MTNTKATKRAFLISVLSILLCMSMLAGSTFAWFTDIATTGVNNIQAGKLDIALEMLVDGVWVNAEGKTLDFIKAECAEDEEILWEPGCTYQLPTLRIVNNGDLHLKYMLVITGIAGDEKLNEVIEWTYGAYTVGSEYVALAPNAASEEIIIQGHMKEEAGNEYQGLSIEGISITVFATQLNEESDSFGPNYDENAPTLFMIGETRYETLAEAIAAANDGDTIAFSGVITLPTDGTLKNRTLTFQAIDESISVIDMKNVATGQSTSGANLTFKGVELVFDNTANYKGIQHAAKVVYEDCTIHGKQFLYAPAEFTGCEFINYMDYCVWTYGSDAAFDGCTFTTGGKAILVYNEATTDDTVTVTGCTFNSNGQVATDKAAVETGINTADSKHTLVINNSTANGFAANKSNSPLWGNKNNMDADHLKVTIDGALQIHAEAGKNIDYVVKNEDGTYGTVVLEDTAIVTNAVVVFGEYKAGGTSGGSDYLFDTTTTLNKVSIVDNEVKSWVNANGEASSWHFGTLIMGTANLTDCTITGTTINDDSEFPNGTVVDLGIFNYSKATLTRGEYGTVVAWAWTDVTVDGAKIDQISANCRCTATGARANNKLTIKAGSEVGLIQMNTDAFVVGSGLQSVAITIEEGATVGTLDLTLAKFEDSNTHINIAEGTVSTIIVGENTYTSVADFYAAYPNAE